ncbi:MAG: ComF family protein [Planctomycetes bacterium]|nr:ComF family protein [Planctomycetota bacterium]
MNHLGPWRRGLRELCRSLIEVLLPPTCGACGQSSGGPLCGLCTAHLQRIRPPWCPRCAEPLLLAGDRCRADHRTLTGLAFARAPFAYAGTGGALVRRWKLDGDPVAAATLGRAMAIAVAADCLGPWRKALLVAVPLHAERRRQRGFDQAEWLARDLARRLGLEYLPGALRRTRRTMPQGDPRVLSRSRNVAGAFATARARDLADRRVVLIDDVRTSGATARECAQVLRAAGVSQVALLTACRS